MVAGYFLMGAACWGVLAIYGPVLAAEVGYQFKRETQTGTSIKWWQRFWPQISLDLVPPTLATGYSIVIPKIFVAEPVVMNVDPNDKAAYREALQRGIAHAAGTGMPGDGSLGYYFAHSSGMNMLFPQKRAMFYLLPKVEVGDEVVIYKDKMKYKYRVTGKQITAPDDVSFLYQKTDKELIFLQTCWPIGTSLQRMLVMAERV